jgi:hypothetical protein
MDLLGRDLLGRSASRTCLVGTWSVAPPRGLARQGPSQLLCLTDLLGRDLAGWSFCLMELLGRDLVGEGILRSGGGVHPP